MATSLLLGMFMGTIAYVSVGRLSDWFKTGALVVHRKWSVGPDAVTYSSDPVGFLAELGLNVFLIAAGGLAVLAACREIIVVVMGPQSRFLGPMSWQFASRMMSVLIGISICFLLIISLFGLLRRFVQ
ncbi:hypothetical protein [Bradyrhizobium sp. C9]|uniref:hypothetical protein n=1 Tax=Bradyrhizobium sp. C9 TaxID=142585 RepID=UPI001177530D|nr:hypothetical protein [Bradyrhizobium sp. C9]